MVSTIRRRRRIMKTPGTQWLSIITLLHLKNNTNTNTGSIPSITSITSVMSIIMGSVNITRDIMSILHRRRRSILLSSLSRPAPSRNPPSRFPRPECLLVLVTRHKLRLEKSRFRGTSNGLLRRLMSQSMSLNPPGRRLWSQAGMLKGWLKRFPPIHEVWVLTRYFRQPPPSDSKPEALNFPQTHYEMSSDAAPFVPPERYPSPPRNMYYEVPKEPPAPARQRPPPIFPWEGHRSRPSRVFANDEAQAGPSASEESRTESLGQSRGFDGSRATAEPSVTAASSGDQKSEPVTPVTPTVHISGSVPWTSFTRTNAWDEVPEIERYVDSLQQKHRRNKSSVSSPGGLRLVGLGMGQEGRQALEDSFQRRGSKVTDFPSEVERPSLPVTPAPIRRPRFWGGGAPGFGDPGEDDDPLLPAAEGVPGQSDWVCVHGIRWHPADCLCDLTNVLRYHKDPVEQLQKLARQQSEVLQRTFGGRPTAAGGEGKTGGGPGGREIPSRPLPFGSEDVGSTMYTAQPVVLSPKPVKPPSYSASPAQQLLGSEGQSTPRTAAETTAIAQLSYGGPGAAFEKGEEVPARGVAAALPTKEERDVLET